MINEIYSIFNNLKKYWHVRITHDCLLFAATAISTITATKKETPPIVTGTVTNTDEILRGLNGRGHF